MKRTSLAIRNKVLVVSVLLGAAFSAVSAATNAQTLNNEQIFEPVPRLVQSQPTLFQAPSDAIVLFGGGEKDLEQWQEVGSGDPASWLLLNDSMTVNRAMGASTSIETKRTFRDIQLHIEWSTNPVIDGDQQLRGNSGIFLHSQFELQVLDSWQNPTYVNGQAGSIYLQYPPLVNASRPAGEWQSYDITFEAPRFNAAGELETPAYISVLHNGVVVQNRSEILGATYTAHPSYDVTCTPYAQTVAVDCSGAMPLILQDHGQVVSYRNIWVREL